MNTLITRLESTKKGSRTSCRKKVLFLPHDGRIRWLTSVKSSNNIADRFYESNGLFSQRSFKLLHLPFSARWAQWNTRSLGNLQRTVIWVSWWATETHGVVQTRKDSNSRIVRWRLGKRMWSPERESIMRRLCWWNSKRTKHFEQGWPSWKTNLHIVPTANSCSPNKLRQINWTSKLWPK